MLNWKSKCKIKLFFIFNLLSEFYFFFKFELTLFELILSELTQSGTTKCQILYCGVLKSAKKVLHLFESPPTLPHHPIFQSVPKMLFFRLKITTCFSPIKMNLLSISSIISKLEKQAINFFCSRKFFKPVIDKLCVVFSRNRNNIIVNMENLLQINYHFCDEIYHSYVQSIV